MSSPTILVVDDDADMRLYVRGCLGRLGAKVDRVLEAADGLEALPVVRSGAVEMVITDVVLPGLDGYGLCRAIKTDPELRHLVVLLISGEADGPPLGIDADGFLAKPFNAGQLRTVVEELLLRRFRERGEGME